MTFDFRGTDRMLDTAGKVLADVRANLANVPATSYEALKAATTTVATAVESIRTARNRVADLIADGTVPADARTRLVNRLADEQREAVRHAHQRLAAQLDVADKLLRYEAMPSEPDNTHDFHREIAHLRELVAMMPTDEVDSYLTELAQRDSATAGVLLRTDAGRDIVRAKLGRQRMETLFKALEANALERAKAVGGDRARAAAALEQVGRIRGISDALHSAARYLAEEGAKAAKDAETAFAQNMARTAYVAGMRAAGARV